MARKRASSQAPTIDLMLERMWREIPGAGRCPCKWGKLVNYIQYEVGESERREAADSIIHLAINEGQELPDTQYRVARCTGNDIKVTSVDDERSEVWVPVRYLLESWAAIPSGERPPHPLLPFAKSYLDTPRRTSIRRARKGFIPDIASTRTKGMMTNPAPLDAVLLPGLQVRMLPEWESEELERPALIALFDRLSEYRYVSGKQAPPSSLPMRLFVEALTMLTLWERNGQVWSKPVTVKEIVRDWLQWDSSNYYPKDPYQGGALRSAFGLLHNLAVPTEDGWYHPVVVGGISKGGDWGLRSEIELLLRLPARQGDNKGAGAAIDMAMARHLGNRSTQAYRAYIHLVCDWDRTASRRSQVVNPVLPGVRRTPAGQIINPEGRPVYDINEEPVFDRRHPAATVDDSLVPELNPYRNRWYPEYDAEGIMRLALPQHMIRESRRRGQYLAQAKEAIKLIAGSGGCYIETLGTEGELPWRIMPPQDFNQLPKFFEPAALPPDGLQGRLV